MAMNNIRVVLVHTSHPGNIGGVARAMKNMGLTRLTLVKPKAFPAPEALWRAASAEAVLVNATVVETVEEAVRGPSLLWVPVRENGAFRGLFKTLATVVSVFIAMRLKTRKWPYSLVEKTVAYSTRS